VAAPHKGSVKYDLVITFSHFLSNKKRVQSASHYTLWKSTKMPFVELITNVSLTRKQTEELALSLSTCAAETLQKPEFVFGINVRANEVLTFAGNWDPCMLPVLSALLANYHLRDDRIKKKPFTPDD
jgi:hypothetical protein